jgi:hypothetical protein
MDLKKDKTPKVLFSLRLSNRVTGESLIATVYYPETHKSFSTLTNLWHEDMRSTVAFRIGLRESEDMVAGGSLLEIFWMSTECIRQKIPAHTEADWLSDSGAASWVILPKTIPISWGYEFHNELVKAVDERVRRFISKVDKRRRAHEATMKRKRRP